MRGCPLGSSGPPHPWLPVGVALIKNITAKKKMECASLVCVQVPSTNSVSCPVTGSFGSCIGYSDEMLCLSENVCVRQTGLQAMSHSD